VRSILETFQTDMIPRVKIGVERPGGKRPAAEAVLTPFREEERPVIEVAMEEALKRLDGMVGSLAPTRVGSPDTS